MTRTPESPPGELLVDGETATLSFQRFLPHPPEAVWDALTDPASFAARARELYPDAVMATTMRTDGLDALKAALRRRNRIDRPMVAVRLPLSAGARAASLYRLGEVVSREESSDGYALVVRLDRWQIERLKAEGVDIDDAQPVARQRAIG